MKLIKRNYNSETNVTTLTVRHEFTPLGITLWQRIVEYEATKEWPDGYWNWVKLPNKNLVPTSLSFQLDRWNRDFV